VKDRWEELVDRYTAELARTVEQLQKEVAGRQHVEAILYERTQELTFLNRISQALSSTLDLDQVLGTLLDQVRNLLGATSSSVWLTDPVTGELVCHHTVGLQSELVLGKRVPPGLGISGWVVEHGQSLRLANAQADERHYADVDRQGTLAVGSMLCVPLRVRGKTIGVINVVNTAVDSFEAGDMTMLELLSTSAATAIENARLVETLRQQTAELQARNEELRAFAHTVAHDLKGPLWPVLGYAEMLAKDLEKLAPADVHEFLDVILKNAQKSCDIIEELLMFAETSQSQVKVKPLDMSVIVDEAMQRLHSLIKEHAAAIDVPDAHRWPVALGHGPWVEEVWANYISNAIRHGSTPEVTLCVELGADEPVDGTVRFWVRDNGSGISPENQAKLFTPFTRLHQVRVTGHGLGLSIVRSIVEKLGGQVGVESDGVPGHGSLFSFTLPLAPARPLDERVELDNWQTMLESVRDPSAQTRL
jgi:signal transduction histidine kinase